MVEECLVAVLLSASRDKEYHGCLCCAVFGQRQSAVEDKVSVPELHLFGLIREGAYGCLRTVDLRCSLLERQGKGESVLGIVAGDNGLSNIFDNVLDPTGCPVSMYTSTSFLNISVYLLLFIISIYILSYYYI